MRPQPRRILRALAAGVAASLVLCATASGQHPEITAEKLKAAFLHNFARFIEWPKEAREGPLTLCVIGDIGVATELQRAVDGHTIDGRMVTVLRVNEDRLRHCHMIYLSRLDPARTRSLVAGLYDAPIVTVSDDDRFAQSGGVIGLFYEGNKMRFTINVGAARRARLEISSRLLSVANIVGKRGL